MKNMEGESSDISVQLRQRLLALIQQVQRDQASLKLHQSSSIPADVVAAGESAYTRLFDSLTATLHNLDRSQAAEKKLQ